MMMRGLAVDLRRLLKAEPVGDVSFLCAGREARPVLSTSATAGTALWM
jgi:hypothetical protein